MSEEEPNWFTRYVKTHDQDHQQLERKIEGLENQYNIKTLTNTINMLIDNNVKVRELEQKLSNFGETLGSQMGINLKALNKYKMLEQSIKEIKEISLRAITDNISEWVDDYTEFKLIVLNFLDNSASYHARQNNSEWALEIRKFIKRLKEIKTKKTKLKKKVEYPEWCKPNECPGDVDCSECPHKPLDPIEIIVKRTHVIIKFENETRRYKYLEGRFMEPNQLLLILERDLETKALRTNTHM